MKSPQDGDRLIFNKQVSVPEPFPSSAGWFPTEGQTLTQVYGRGEPTPSLPLSEMAELDVQEYYPYLLKGSAEYERRVKEFLAKYV